MILNKHRVISVVGAGGKTTYIHRLRAVYKSNNVKCLVTTTTHMMIEADTDISEDAAVIADKLNRCGYCMAGSICANDSRKITALPQHVLEEVIPHCECVLIEADGAKHYSAKYPAECEPVIYQSSDEVVVIMGLEAIGKRVGEAVFRYECMKNTYNIDEDTIVTFELLSTIVHEVYYPRIEKVAPNADVTVLYSKLTEGQLEFISECEAHSLYE